MINNIDNVSLDQFENLFKELQSLEQEFKGGRLGLAESIERYKVASNLYNSLYYMLQSAESEITSISMAEIEMQKQ